MAVNININFNGVGTPTVSGLGDRSLAWEEPEEEDFYDGLTQQMKSMSGVDAVTAKSMVEKMDFDQSLKKQRQLNGVKYKHDVELLKRETEEYLMLTGNKSNVEKVFQDMTNDGKRAYAGQNDKVMQVGKIVRGQPKNIVNIGTPAEPNSTIKETLFHELTHHVEFESPDKAVIARDWVRRRATGSLEKLSILTGDDKYKDTEIAYPDKFISPYVGKFYGQAPVTEVLTMGFQHFASPTSLNELYNKDKEHFYLILGLIAG